MKRFLTTNHLLFALVVSLLCSLLFTFPAVLHSTTAYIGDREDNYQFAAYIGLAAKHVSIGALPFQHTDFWRYPVGFDFARGFDSYVAVGLGMILTLMVGLPLSYNLTIFLLMTINGLCSYVLFRFVSKSNLLGLLGMLIYGFSFYVLAKAFSHPNLLFTGGISLFVWSVLRIISKPVLSTKDYVVCMLSVVLVAAGSLVYFVYLVLFCPIFFVLGWCIYAHKRDQLLKKLQDSQKLILFLGACGVLSLLLLYFPQLAAFVSGNFVILDRQKILYELTPSLLDFFLPNHYLHLFVSNILPNPSSASIEKVVFFGWIEMLIFLVFFFSKVSIKTKVSIGFGFLVPFILSLGYGKEDSFFLLPYHGLSQIFPFRILIETGRYTSISYLFLTLGIIVFLTTLPKNKRTYVLISLIFLLVIFERLPESVYLSTDLNASSYVTVVKNQQTKAVLDLPINTFYPNYDLLSIGYDKAIMNGYFHWSADGKFERTYTDSLLFGRYVCDPHDPVITKGLDYAAEQTQDEQMLNVMQQNNINVIVVHKDYFFFVPFSDTACKNVRMRLNRLIPYVTTLTPTSQTSEKQLKTHSEGTAAFSFFIPQDGMLYLDSTFIAPSKLAPFAIYLNNQPVSFPYTWTVNTQAAQMEISPKYTIHFPVQGGSYLRFSSDESITDTYFSLWYRYIPNANAAMIPEQTTQIKKVFEDAKTIVYILQ